jgi:hypothetical protein
MAQPLTRTDFGQYILGKLGAPIINIEMAPAQLNACIDDALTMFREFHYDATQRTYMKHQVTTEDMANHYLKCDDSIMSVVRIVATFADNLSIFDIRYQLRLQDFYNFSNVSLQHYYITMEKLRLIEWTLNPEATISFDRLNNKIFLNVDWGHTVNVGDWFIIEVYQYLDETTRIWQDQWLKKYAVAVARKQWGANVKKYNGIQTLGNTLLNGQAIYDEGKEEMETLEEILHHDYQIPPRLFIG